MIGALLFLEETVMSKIFDELDLIGQALPDARQSREYDAKEIEDTLKHNVFFARGRFSDLSVLYDVDQVANDSFRRLNQLKLHVHLRARHDLLHELKQLSQLERARLLDRAADKLFDERLDDQEARQLC